MLNYWCRNISICQYYWDVFNSIMAFIKILKMQLYFHLPPLQRKWTLASTVSNLMFDDSMKAGTREKFLWHKTGIKTIKGIQFWNFICIFTKWNKHWLHCLIMTVYSKVISTWIQATVIHNPHSLVACIHT